MYKNIRTQYLWGMYLYLFYHFLCPHKLLYIKESFVSLISKRVSYLRDHFLLHLCVLMLCSWTHHFMSGKMLSLRQPILQQHWFTSFHLQEDKEENKFETKFPCYQISKQMICAVLIQLAKNGSFGYIVLRFSLP